MSAQEDMALVLKHLKSNGSTPWTWVFYGDSITHGATHTHGFRCFPEIFAERVRWEMRLLYDVVINTAISGQNTVHLLDEKHYDWRVRRFDPNVVFLLVGINDIAKYNDLAKFGVDFRTLVQRIRQDNAIPIVQTYNSILPKTDDEKYMLRYKLLEQYNQTIRQTAQEESVILFDHDLYWKEHAADENTLKSWMGEPIHPGGRGQLEMAKFIFQQLGIFDPEAPCCNPIGTPQSLL